MGHTNNPGKTVRGYERVNPNRTLYRHETILGIIQNVFSPI